MPLLLVPSSDIERMAASESPLSMIRGVQANICQGDVVFSNESRGKQCMTNCIVFLMYCCLKRFEDIDKNDMNFTLLRGKMFHYGILHPDQELCIFQIYKVCEFQMC